VLIAACLSTGVSLYRADATPPPATEIRLPGAPAFDADLQTRLRAAWQAQQPQSKPQTSHFSADHSPQYINRLVFESSPYLQQHAYNPVNWYPWGDEAFTAARRENKPIFLSIGYSTCHWCHVMERECFENEKIAVLLNEDFIAIKVDREERPDVDAVYVEAVSRLTGSAGWPLNVFLTPERQPFYGGTYFPPDQFTKVLTTLADAWKTKHDDVLRASADLTGALQASTALGTPAELNLDTLHHAYNQMVRSFDATYGGFGRAPKFPQAHMLTFLLRYWQRSGQAQAREMAAVTLDHMARGGIHDQLGGGFHRYATDARWKVPHFEKMLYDQALTARAYLEAYQATGNPQDAAAARDTFAYVLRDLTAPSGGFYSAEDADSEGGEGRFYLWSREDIITVLGQQGALIADFYGVIDPQGRTPLSIPMPADAFATLHGLDATAFQRTLLEANRALLAARSKRVRPLRDDKIITAWNGLMISSLAYGSVVLGDPRYADAAARAADVILTRLQRDGRLLRSFRNGPAATPAYLDDYASLVLGLSDLYAATFEARWLREADRLTRDMMRLFNDPTNGGLRYTAADHEQLIASNDDTYDGALPAAQSLAALALLRLGRLTMNKVFESCGRAVLSANAQSVAQAPQAHTEMLMALDFALGPTKEIVVAGAANTDATRALLLIIRRQYLPRSVLALHPPDDRAIEALVPFLKNQTMIGGSPAAYVCENYVCKLPTGDPTKLKELLAATR
jgi:uncharacterized protein YyaL (SSP411 family)